MQPHWKVFFYIFFSLLTPQRWSVQCFIWMGQDIIDGFVPRLFMYNMLNRCSIWVLAVQSVLDLLTSKIGSAQLSLPVLLIFGHYNIHPLFTVIASPTKSAVSGPWGRMEHSKPLHLRGNFKAPCPPWSICYHVECQGVSLGLTSGHSSTWHWEGEKEGSKGREREWSWERLNLTKALKQICPTQQSQGSMQ